MWKLVQHEMPLRRFGIAGNQTLEMRQRILLSACWPPGGFDDVPGDDIKIEEPGQRAMPDILEFAPQHRHRFFAAFYSSFLFHWILTS